MKTTAKFFIIMSIILTFYLVLPVVIGIVALKRIEKATCKEELKEISIMTFLFCNMIAGLFMFCISDEEFSAKRVSDNDNSKSEVILDDGENGPYNRIVKLKELLDKGVITKEVYLEKQRCYLEFL